MIFELRALPIPQDEEKTFWFIFSGDKILVEHGEAVSKIPFINSSNEMAAITINKIYLGRIDSHPCFAAEIPKGVLINSTLSFIGIRQLFGNVEDELFWLAARAYHLVNWSRNNQYCGRCGEKTLQNTREHSKQCPKCSLSIYPKISPAVIVAVTKENKLLLAKNINSTTGFYSVLAGFVEPGENLEDCVKREIKEEAGIDVNNINYFGSQPWPFPDSLMVAFTAEYESGELNIDKNELSDAGWYSAYEMPEVPGKMSISRMLIDWFVINNK